MSEHRSSSAVRNLRSIFENKANSDLDDSESRGRSPSGRPSITDANGRPLSKVRASFINVQHPIMSSPPQNEAATQAKRGSAFEVRTQSFSTNDVSPAGVAEMKREVAEEQTRRASIPDLQESEGAIESTGTTPAVELNQDQTLGVIDHAASKLSEMELPPPTEDEEGEKKAEKPNSTQPTEEKKNADENEPPANPDKPITGKEEEQGTMKPAMADDEAAVSGGQALPPVVEDLRPQNEAQKDTPKKTETTTQTASPSKTKPQAKTTPQKSVSKPAATTGSTPKKPESISVGSAEKASDSNMKSPSTDPKSPSSTKSPLSPLGAPKQTMGRKASRSSLTAPTAASSARGRRESNTVKSTSKPQPRETTKPVNLPSHLTAPTASSRAKHDAESNTSTKPAASRPSVSRVPPKQTSTSKPAPRTSTAGRQEPSAPRKTTTAAPSDGSFLERMMRPTASSAQKVHDKPADPKSPPRRTKSVAKKPAAAKINGAAKPAPKAGSASKPVAASEPAEQKPAAKASEAVTDVEQQTEAPAQTNGKVEPTEIPDVPVPAEEKGNATPQHASSDNTQPADAALESTPAFAEDNIR